MQSSYHPLLYADGEHHRTGWLLIGATLLGDTLLFLLLDSLIRIDYIAPQPLEIYLLLFFSIPFVLSILNAKLTNGLLFSLGVGMVPAFLLTVLAVIAELRGRVAGDTSILPILLVLVFVGALVSIVGFGIGMAAFSRRWGTTE